MVKLVDSKGMDLNITNSSLPAHYILPSRSNVSLTDGQKVGVGDTIARTPRETSQTHTSAAKWPTHSREARFVSPRRRKNRDPELRAQP